MHVYSLNNGHVAWVPTGIVSVRKEATKSSATAKTVLILRLVCPVSTCTYIGMWFYRHRNVLSYVSDIVYSVIDWPNFCKWKF